MALRVNPRSAYRWNHLAGRYIASSGQFVPRVAVRAEIDQSIVDADARVVALARSLKGGSISLGQWQVAMRGEIADAHVAAVASARGGWAQMRQADYGRAGQRIREQYAFLRHRAEEIAAGKPLSEGSAKLYVRSARETYHLADRGEQQLRGMTEERSIRHAGDSCTECISEAAREWVQIGDLVPIGARICLSNCRCRVEFRAAA